MRYSPILTSFNGGELSPRMEGRVDQAIYGISVKELLNFVPTVEGPAMKRTGFRHIRAAMASANWLSGFTFNRTQAYAIEWGEQSLRFYTNGGRIETGGGAAYEVAVPYAAAEAPFVSQQQSFDRLYLAHGGHKPAALTRTGAETFVHAPLALRNGPFADANGNDAVTVSASGTSGMVTVTANAPIFLPGHVGAVFRIEAEDFSDIPAWEGGYKGIKKGVSKRRSEGRVYVAETSGKTGFVQPVHSRGAEYDGAASGQDDNSKDAGGIRWRYLHDRFGIGTIAAVGGGGTSATLNVTRRLPDSVKTVPTQRWAHGAFSDAAGWPRIVLLAFGRLIFFSDFEIVASVVADYGGGAVNFAEYGESGLLSPDMGFRRRLDIANPILWARRDRGGILVGTADGEGVIRKLNAAEAFSSDNMELDWQSYYGSDPVWPAQTGTSTIFLQCGGRKLRECNNTQEQDRYIAPNINVWQRHILKSGARQLTFQKNPEELLWAVRNDGVLALHPHVPEQEVKGFARAIHAGGPVLSAVALPSQDGSREELWVLVDGGAAGKSVELQAAPWEENESRLEDAFFVDSGVSYEGPALAEFSTGLGHLAGKKVAVLADGGVVGGLAVSADGVLRLPRKAAKVHVGLGYQARLTWLRPEMRSANGSTSQGKRKRLVSVMLRVLETVGIRVDPGTGVADQLIDRPTRSGMDAPVAPFSGDTDGKSIGGKWDRNGQGTIISDDPLPCMVVAAMPSIEVGE